MKYSELIEEKINSKKNQLHLKQKEAGRELESLLNIEELLKSKYTYMILSGLGLIVFRRKIPKYIKKLLRYFFYNYPIKSIFTNRKKRFGKK